MARIYRRSRDALAVFGRLELVQPLAPFSRGCRKVVIRTTYQ